jgi:Skp family chaperone for outer membrane proteins
MKAWTWLTLGLTLVILSDPSLAAKDLKFAMVDMQKVVGDYNKTTELSTRFDEDVAARRKVLAEQAQEIEKLNMEYEKSKVALSEKARKEKEYIITKKAEDFEKSKARMTEELDKKRADLNDLLMQEIRVEVERLAKSRGYDIVFDKAAFLYSKEGASVDITEEVLANLEKQNASSKK